MNKKKLMSETPDEEVDYGSFDVINSNIQSDHEWSTPQNDSLDYESDKSVLVKLVKSQQQR